jgi:hypothetical protein
MNRSAQATCLSSSLVISRIRTLVSIGPGLLFLSAKHSVVNIGGTEPGSTADDDLAAVLPHSRTEPGPTPGFRRMSSATEICPWAVSFDCAMARLYITPVMHRGAGGYCFG